ncbi:TrkH family potassium uptake protein [Tamaricihabitans halophyticus]|nr:potassium transporter TrkG [Tamaricihabitans halophyticus]
MARKLLPSGGHPARAVMAGFATAIAIGTVLLMLPISSNDGTATDLVGALFTATSAVCLTGLTIYDTGDHWSEFGHVVIACLVQLGGLGIMTVASLLGLLVARRFGLRMQLSAQRETKALRLGELRAVVAGVIKFSLIFEFIIACILTGRFFFGYEHSLGKALYEGVFHAISAFNNAGFALYSDSMTRFVDDPWIAIPIPVAVIVGGLGFPVWFEIGRRLRGRVLWSMHTKITVLTSAVLLVFAFSFITIAEWSNEQTMGPLSVPGKLLAGFFAGTMPRSAGFNSIEIGEMHSSSLLLQDVLMFIGGGSASTAGGIKVTTFALLAFVIYAELRGRSSVHVFGRKLAASVQRQALTIALLTVGLVMITTLTLLTMTDFEFEKVLFEAISATCTVGLSTGITPDLPPAAHVVMSLLMFAGRIGPITLGAALALRDRPRRYELPEERALLG